MEPFAYGIQAPIGSVTPLFHKLKDAEDYIAKLTDSRDEAKIIPLYRDATLTDAEREAVSFAYEMLCQRARELQAVHAMESSRRCVEASRALQGLFERMGGRQ